MKDLAIGDCHFGVKSNSIQFLEQQLRFFHEVVIPELSKGIYNRVIFLGDIFDIRYAINQYIGYEVKCMIRFLCNNFPNTIFYIVAGNHDYYSQDIEFAQYNAYNLLFGYEFISMHPNLRIVNKDYLIEDNTLFAPWYWTENIDNFKSMIENISNENITTIYCHSDLAAWPIDGRLEIKPKDVTVISGHIHNVQQDKFNRLYNVGSIFPINFSDVNTKKYLYRYDTTTQKFEEAIENTISPKFIQYSNEEIFTLNKDDLKNCHVRLFITSDNINKAQYIEKLNEIKKTFDYESIKIQTINVENIKDLISDNIYATNMDSFIESNIPENLKEKYEHIKEIVNRNED